MCSFGYGLFFILLSLVYQASSFNINVENPTFINGFAENGSYFGYSVAQAQARSNKWILVGAPRSDDPSMPGVKRPGAVYRCSISNRVPECIILNIDNNTGSDEIPFNGANVRLRHGKNDSWLGGTIAVGSELTNGFATCAPKWHNRSSNDEYFMNGMCYEVPLDFNMENVRKLPVFVNRFYLIIPIHGRNVYHYAFAELGASLHYSKRGSNGVDHLLIGSPGLLDWTGGFVDVQRNGIRAMRNAVNDTTTTKSYIGSATSSGKYFGDGVLYYAVGAPKDEMTGMVVLFKSDDSALILQQAYLTLKGTDEDNKELPINAYFGATLCTVDVNKDGADDLLVGAPLYSSHTNDVFNDMVDLGLVAVYIGSPNLPSFLIPPRILKGVEPYGRFGTAIESLGDINGDMYNDVAVGAPYENDYQGAVYIFNGCTEGLWPTYSQRIRASDINTGISGFGISISSGIDLNSDDINDVLVGSYLSDEVVMLLGQPVLSMNGELNVLDKHFDQTNFIEVDERDKKVHVCFQFSDRRCSHVELLVTTKLDVGYSNQARVKFLKNNRKDIEDYIVLYRDVIICTPMNEIFAVTTNDYVSDILITAEYAVKAISCPSYEVTATINRFDGDNPRDPRLILQKMMQFRRECPNNICKTDLMLAVDGIYVNSDGNFLIGNQDLTLDVTITKTGDPSYGSNFLLLYPSFLGYTKLRQIFGDTYVSCSKVDQNSNETDMVLMMADDEAGLNCFFGNPMSNDTGVRFQLHMRVPPIVSISSMTLNMFVETMSTEQNPNNNVHHMTIYMKHHVEAVFSGIATQDLVYVKDSEEGSYDVEHIYELVNRGPSTMVEAYMNISYPAFLQSGNPLMYLNSTEAKCQSPCDVRCSIQNARTAPPIYQYINGRLLPMSHTNTEEISVVKKQNCLTEICPMLQCTIRNIQAQKSAVVYLGFVLQKEIKKSLGDKKIMEFISQATVQINETNLISNRTHFDQQLMTTVKEKTIVQQKFPWWIIIVSIIAGLLLIIIIILILWKLGFFKRKTRDQVREMRKSRPPVTSNINGDNQPNGKRKDSYTDSEDGIIDREQPPAKC